MARLSIPWRAESSHLTCHTAMQQFAPRLFDPEGRIQNEAFFEAAATRMLDDLAWWTAALNAAREDLP